MAKYKIKDKNTGETLTIKSDAPPTQDDAQKIFESSGLREPETRFQKVARTTSKIAPTAGAITGGVIGSILGPLGAIAGTTGGTGTGLALGEGLEDIAGIQEETIKERADEAIREPLVAGALDAATAGAMKLAKPVAQAGKGVARGVFRSFVPKNASPKLFSSIFKLSGKSASALRPQKTAKELVKHGIFGDLDDFIKIANRVTGKNGIITQVTDDAAKAINGSFSIKPMRKAIGEAVEEATNITPTQLKRLEKHVNKIVGEGNNIEPLKALEVERELETIGYALAEKARQSSNAISAVKAEQQADIYLKAAKAIKGTIDDLGSKHKVIDKFKKPEIINEIKEISPRLAKQFKSAKTLSELRSIAAPFVRLKQMTDITLANESSAFMQSIAGGKRNILDSLLGTLKRPEAASSFAKVINDLGESTVGQGLKAAGKATRKVGETAAKTQDIVPRVLIQLGLMGSRED